jgi:hypothetical protein
MPPSARRRPPKSPALPIDLEEIEQDPGFRGMLSFLEVSPADRAELLAQRAVAEANRPSGYLPMGREQPVDSPADLLDTPADQSPVDQLTADETKPKADLFPGTGRAPTGQLPPGTVPYMDVEGRGKRALRYCRTAQDGHTASEQLAFQALWTYALQYGRPENSRSSLVDIGLSQLCSLLASDHKNVKRLIGSLRDKLALEIVRQPDYRLAVPTRYRIFHPDEVLDRRRNAGLVWVIRTRTIRFVPLERVNGLVAEQSLGHLPGGDIPGVARAAQTEPSAFPVWLARQLNEWITIDDDAVRRIWDACRRGLPDCTEEEVHWFCRSKEPLIRAGTIDDAIGLLVRSVPQFFARGGAAALLDYRKDQARAQERERKRERQVAMMILDDTESTEVETAWAKAILDA